MSVLTGDLGDGFVPGRHLLDAYGRGGFRFAGMSHRGSILAMPSGVRAWAVETIAALGPEDFDPVFTADPPVELLILGTGAEPALAPAAVRRRFREAGVGLDTMQTGAAARTYNVLVAEERRVAAALIAVS